MIHMKMEIEPVAKSRPRSTRSGRIYTPAKTAEYERDIAKLTKHLPAILGPISVDVVFVLKRPKRTPKKQTGRFMKAGSRGDIDNYVKSLLDGCQRGGVIPNDAAVVKLSAMKIYAAADELPHIEMRIQEVDGAVDFISPL